MSTLFDVFGFLSVLLHGLELVAQTVTVGSVLFALVIVRRDADRPDPDRARTARIVRIAAMTLVGTTLASIGLRTLVLATTLQLAPLGLITAQFAWTGLIRALAAAGIAVLAHPQRITSELTDAGSGVLAGIVLATAVAGSHAAARLDDAAAAYLATIAHQLGAALWLGGLPCFHAALRHASARHAERLGRRYSRASIAGVALIVLGATGYAVVYIGSPGAAYGTAYGAMALAKAALLAVLLWLGLQNFRSIRRGLADAGGVQRLGRTVVVEMGVGLAALMAAASITSTPPAADLVDDRVTIHELAERWRPQVPRLSSPEHASLSLPALQARLDAEALERHDVRRPGAFVPGEGEPPPRNAYDVAWSEYNHHWAGVLVFAMGFAALLGRSGRVGWAMHWPLLFVVLAAIVFVRGDPEVWPLGDIGFFESLKDPEVVQHRMFVVIMIAFALFEWRVQSGRSRSRAAAFAFPLLVALGATLLLAHSHALGNAKEELMVETTHLPVAVLGVVAGWSRWLEVEAHDQRDGRVGGVLWPLCFMVIGLLLLNYREA